MYNSNYYPYYNNQGFYNSLTKFKHFNWSKFLEGTQKTLNVINQAIPVIYQIKPLYENARTALKVVNIINRDEKKNNNKGDNTTTNTTTTTNTKTNTNKEIKKVEPSNSPTYFL